jgi:hypothetical protein
VARAVPEGSIVLAASGPHTILWGREGYFSERNSRLKRLKALPTQASFTEQSITLLPWPVKCMGQFIRSSGILKSKLILEAAAIRGMASKCHSIMSGGHEYMNPP